MSNDVVSKLCPRKVIEALCIKNGSVRFSRGGTKFRYSAIESSPQSNVSLLHQMEAMVLTLCYASCLS